MKGLVIKKNANLFTVESEGKLISLSPSGKTKAKGIFVGDYVDFDEAITGVEERKNLLIRPPMANIDKLFIVIAPSPKPDFVLVDKILIYCHLKGILPIIVINKVDLSDEKFIQEVQEDYCAYQVISLSAKSGNVEKLESEIKGICAMAGQSAVGKSSIINALFRSEGLTEVGDLSAKIERGKQTTRIVSLYKLGNGYLADTAGFSLLDLSFVSDIEKEELSSYYPDFLTARGECKYRSCLHEGGECGVIKGVKEGKISKRRYQNYLKILQELKMAKKY
ncbi:MAG: ribosome small subunit-dependent GTPase A [Clostridia bacterium]|nr:ribosome small subunit-dependent GTPase A [Clostridia bacterium]